MPSTIWKEANSAVRNMGMICFPHILFFSNSCNGNSVFRRAENQGCRSIMPPPIRDIMLYIDGHLLDSLRWRSFSRQFFHNPSPYKQAFQNGYGSWLNSSICSQKNRVFCPKYLKEGFYPRELRCPASIITLILYWLFPRWVFHPKISNYIIGSCWKKADLQESLPNVNRPDNISAGLLYILISVYTSVNNVAQFFSIIVLYHAIKSIVVGVKFDSGQVIYRYHVFVVDKSQTSSKYFRVWRRGIEGGGIQVPAMEFS